MKKWLVGSGLLLLSAPLLATMEFSPSAILQWEAKAFAGETDYRLHGEHILAQSNGSASGLFYENTIDLNATPVLHWRWKPVDFPKVTDERVKGGDDFALRIYVVARTGWGPWNVKAITYVWSQTQRSGYAWDNPFAGDKVKMVALRDSSDTPDWTTESRNIQQDFMRYFDLEVSEISAIAIMTDGDNSGSVATGLYSGLRSDSR
uniref:DUF3047 domain-containing protein n=1 Tax=Thaumasiovibrio occultus TaxID=1891184 RepID=UPI00131BA956|nr:DUF3047 domain-containing protein [Thaumasiovibrio occultus]